MTSAEDAHRAAWDAASGPATSAEVHGAVVAYPSVCVAPPTIGASSPAESVELPADSALPRNFLLTGKLDNLFGASLPVDFYSYHGEFPKGLVLPPGVSTPIYQLVKLKENLVLSSILPPLAGTALDRLPFKNVVFTYQNCAIDPSKTPGFFVNADVVFTESLGAIHDALTTVLDISNPVLHVQGNLSKTRSFHDPLDPSDFSLIGTFPDVVFAPSSELRFSAIGVELLGSQHDLRVFGAMHIGLDRTLDLAFTITETGGELALVAKQTGLWHDAFGVKGFSVNALLLSTKLDPSKPIIGLDFAVSATVSFGATTAALRGEYKSDKSFSVSASIANFGTSGLLALYEQLHSDTLSLPELGIDIGDATLTIASGGAFFLVLRRVAVEHHVGVDAEVAFSPDGLVLKAGVKDAAICFGPVELHGSYMHITLSSGRRSSSVLVGGSLLWESFALEAGVHLYRDASELHWTLFASFGDVHERLTLGSLVSDLESTFLGHVTLTETTFIVASKDDASCGPHNPTRFPIIQGIQICAILDHIKPIPDLLRCTEPPRLLLSAGWSKTNGFSLNIVLPSPLTLDLGRGIVTDPISLEIHTRSGEHALDLGSPTIQLTTGVKIPVPHDPVPLHFSMTLAFNAVQGRATGQLDGYWTNPFGLSPNLRVGPRVALTLGVIIEELLVSPFGFVGGLRVGEKVLDVAFAVSEIPSQEVLSAEIEDLHITDVVLFARDLTQRAIPMVPDFMSFKDVKFYLCPLGTTIRSIAYKRGCQFTADILLFGQSGQVTVEVDGVDIVASVTVDGFALGGLYLTGIDGPKVGADVGIGEQKQAGAFKGKVVLFDMEIILDLKFDLLPTPAFHFQFTLPFTPHLSISVDATMLSPIADMHDLTGLDFHLVAVLEQDILAYIAESVNAQFVRVAQSAEEDIAAKQAGIDATKKRLLDAIEEEQKRVDAANALCTAGSEAANARFRETTDAYNARVSELQSQLDAATMKYRTDIATAKTRVANVQAARAAQMHVAEVELAKVEKGCADAIGVARKEMHDAERDMHARFGDADKRILIAQTSANRLQTDIDSLDAKIIYLENLTGVKAIAQAGLPALYAARGTLMTSMMTAKGVLVAANALIESQSYIIAQRTLRSSQLTLAAAEISSSAAVAAARQALDATDLATQAALVTATLVLSEVEQLGPFAVAAASETLESYRETGVATLEAAQASVDAVAKGSDWVAYEAALAGLAAAKAAAHELDIASGALEIAKEAEVGMLSAAQHVAANALTFLELHHVRLEGELRKTTRGAGLAAVVEGKVAGQAFSLQTSYDPRKIAAEFVSVLLRRLLEQVSTSIVCIPSA
ncbi:FAD-binding PCMH-type domain-containing protein [Mycena kentingensis (nom. inval.)]|nr:FAD-binding PCMH-type domain-containing protein [Mycena kentingensis (nom. inval.)]